MCAPYSLGSADYPKVTGDARRTRWPVYAHVFLCLMQCGLSDRAERFLNTHRVDYESAYGAPDGDLSKLAQIKTSSQLPKPWGEGRADVSDPPCAL